MRWRIRGFCLALCLVAASPGLALAEEPGTYTLSPIGPPLGTGQMSFELTVTVNGKPVTKPVTIPSGDIKPAKPVVCAKRDPKTQTVADWEAACLREKAVALAVASQDKAKVMAAAINKAFEAEFKILKAKATTDVTPGTVKVGHNGFMEKVSNTPLGTLTIPGQTAKQGNPFKFTSNGILGEGGDGGKFNPGTPKSPGTKTGFAPAIPGATAVASGVDPVGDPSYVEFGLAGGYVAEVHPTPGMSEAAVLGGLASLLSANGEPASLDPATGALSLDNLVPDGQTVMFGNTDLGLNFTFSQEGLATAGRPPRPPCCKAYWPWEHCPANPAAAGSVASAGGAGSFAREAGR